MISEIEKIVEEACRSEVNHYSYTAWSHHIFHVVKFAKILAKELNADDEIVELAALLHDYASVVNKDFYPEHHVHSARLAEELLKKYNYPEEKIGKIKHCIISHRASKDIQRETIEAEIVASADAMAHFDNISDLLFVAFTIHKMQTDEGTKWVLDKLKRSWNKLMPEAKEIIKDKYDAALEILTLNGE